MRLPERSHFSFLPVIATPMILWVSMSNDVATNEQSARAPPRLTGGRLVVRFVRIRCGHRTWHLMMRATSTISVQRQGRIVLCGRLSVKHHSRLGENQLHYERHRIARVLADIGWNCAALGLEFRANAHLRGQDISLASRPVQVYPVFAIIKVQKHCRITAGRDHSIGRRAFSDLVMSQQ
jgi:hypothetical protein